MRKTFFTLKKKIVFLALCSVVSLSVLAQVSTAVSVDQGTNQVTIGNGYLTRTFSTASGKLKTTGITNYRTDGNATVFTPGTQSEEFVINTLKPTASLNLHPLSKSGWTITANSWSTTEAAPSGPPAAFIDGNINTHWHSNYGTGTGPTAFPYYVIIDLQSSQSFKSFTYTPRQAGENSNGNIGQYEVYLSDTQGTFPTTPAVSGTFTYSGVNPIIVNFPSTVTARYVKFVGKTAHNGLSFGGGAEFDLNADAYVPEVVTAPTKLSKTGWTVAANSVTSQETAPASAILDGSISTIWHSNYGTGTGPTTLPFWFTIDMKASKTINSFCYTPRQTGDNGVVSSYELYIANDTTGGFSPSSLCKKGTLPVNGIKPVWVGLNAPVTGRYVKFVILSTQNGASYGSCAEFDLSSDTYVTQKMTISTSDLELASTTVSDNPSGNGKMIRYAFKPYTFNEVDWTINEVVTMNDGDHYMRKFLELSVPESQQDLAQIDYIDCEFLKTNKSDSTWTHPTMSGGVGGMSGYWISLGQPIYVQGMFFGSEFPDTETSIGDSIGHIRYYSGKTLSMLKSENRLTTDNKFVTWQTVAGAARSTDVQIVQNDFFEYIRAIATPSDFRLQYNSWYDWMMDITKDNIQSSFYEMEKGFSQYGTPPMDSYVVDDGWNAYGPYKSENTTGFWQFNSKFPNGLTESSDLSHRFASNFGLWLGPRGGYNYNAEFGNFLQANGNGAYNPASGDVTTNHKRYLEKLKEFFLDCQDKYKINYWKWDGFSTAPNPNKSDQFITGGEQGMYYMTEHWERWIEMMKAVRAKRESQGAKDLWLSLTCYVNPSPWYLQWANSVWIQNSNDRGEMNTGLSGLVDRILSYRDDRYFDFVKTRQFQFPFSNIYNHDPIYGKTGTPFVSTNLTTDEFRALLYMSATRGNAFWELYYSYDLMNKDLNKWMVNAEAMNWIKENYHILRNSKVFGVTPNTDVTKTGIYGFSCWDGAEGIVSLRNSSSSAKTFTLTLNRTIGVKEGVSGLHRVTVLNYKTTTADDNSATYAYNQQITLTMQPGEARIWQFSPNADTTPAGAAVVKTTANNKVTVKFDERVNITNATFKVNDVAVTAKSLGADYKTVTLTAATMANYSNNVVSFSSVKDYSGNLTTGSASFIHYPDALILQADSVANMAAGSGLTEELNERYALKFINFNKQSANIADTKSVSGISDFNISFMLKTASSNATIFSQGTAVKIGTDASGRLQFSVGDLAVTSRKKVANDTLCFVSVCRENNGMLKIYLNGDIDNSAYDKTKVSQTVLPGQISLGGADFVGQLAKLRVHNIAYPFNTNLSVVANQAYYYQVVSTNGDGGTISPLGKKMIQKGTGQTYTITPGSGYQVKSVLVDGVSVGAVKTYSFSALAADHTIDAQFTPNTAVEEVFSGVKVFPNPVKDILTVTGVENASVSLYNLSGKVLRKIELSETGKLQLNMEQFEDGVYLLKVDKDNAVKTYTITKGK